MRKSSDAAAQAADLLAAAFVRYIDRFRYFTHLARGGFERCEWADVQHISQKRLEVYGEQVDEALAKLEQRLGPEPTERALWARIRTAFAERVKGRNDVELSETFFNSVVRRVFHTVGVDPGLEFVAPAHPAPEPGPPWRMTVRFEREGTLEALVRATLSAFRFDPQWNDLDGDAARLAQVVRQEVGEAQVRGFELVRAPFFRGKGAYLIGRVLTDGVPRPLCIALTNPEGEIVVDAVLCDESEVSIVFSFARSYFLVEMDRPRELIGFLHSIMPRKPISELYNAIGFNRHGKTELYRSLLRHLSETDDRFEFAAGQRGMVMEVFTLPRFPVVFKVMRDRFQYPKTVTHEEVREKYRMVFRHDRAGRLVDAQEFEHLEFDRARFAEPLLEELLSAAGETVRVHDGRIVIRHLYTERRLRPLDLYLDQASPQAQREAVLDYGQALRDLARTNIFPGDMLLKNFGASRHGRLIFYDYDELCRLTDLNFRVLPRARDADDETAAEPWFYVGDNDVFPEEFRGYLGIRGDLLDLFLATHGELLDAAYWRRMQELHERGEVLDVYPYKASRRLRMRPRAREAAETERFRRGGKT